MPEGTVNCTLYEGSGLVYSENLIFIESCTEPARDKNVGKLLFQLVLKIFFCLPILIYIFNERTIYKYSYKPF